MYNSAGKWSTTLSEHRGALLIGIGLLSLLLFVAFGFLMRALLGTRNRGGATPTPAPIAITKKRLLSIWQQFIAPLPQSVRAALPDYDHFIVLGDPGVGKSALISRRVDWQGQASQFLPSYTPDPLIQIYLGGRLVVQEISATLLQITTRDLHEAFRRLWKASLTAERPPTVVVVLKAASLSNSSPDVIRQQAQLIRGKINLLSEMLGTPVRTRICVTHMERVRGYSEFARFLRKSQLPLVLDISGDTENGLIAGFKAYEKYVPRALTSLPVGRFEASVNLLSSAEALLGPVRAFIAALLEGSVASVRPDLQRVYFFSLPAEEDVGNPFDTTGLAQTTAPNVMSRLRRFLAALGIHPLHAGLSLLILSCGLLPLWMAQRRHAERVRVAAEATFEFEQSVRRAQEALGNPSESDVVRRAEQAAARALLTVETAEARFRPLRWMFRKEQAATRQQFVTALRQGYLRPTLEAGVRQRVRDKILYGLAAIYASRNNTLGAIVRSASQDFATTLGLPADICEDYVRESEQPFKERALLLLPPLPSEAARYPIVDLRPWREFVESIDKAVKEPFITNAEHERLRKEAGRLAEALARVRRASVLRRIFQVLSEESPLDMAKLFGINAGVLAPDPWLRDNMETIDRLLKLVRESSLQIHRGGRMSLLALLKWINSLSERSDSDKRRADSPSEKEFIELAFPGNKLFSISEPAWLELLLRSRKRFLLAYRVASAHGSKKGERSQRCCECRPAKHRRRCVPCAEGQLDSAEAQLFLCKKVHKGETAEESAPLKQTRPQEMPPFTASELQPRLASLVVSDQAPDERIDEEYNRALFDREVLPLLRELKRALAESKVLSADEKLKLSRLVRGEIGAYAQRYCAALVRFHLSFHFHGGSGSAADLHTALLNLTRPGSRFVSHLFAVADNASLHGLDDPFLSPLSQCLAEFKPIVRVMYGDDKKGDDKKGGQQHPAADAEPAGLSAYLTAVAKQAEELDGPPASRRPPQDNKAGDATAGRAAPAILEEQLGTLGRSALNALKGSDDSPQKQAEAFLDKAGIIGALRRPFLAPFESVFRHGSHEIERAVAQHFASETLPTVAQLLSRFPFNQGAEREVAPSELDILNEQGGAFWQDVRSFYAPVLSEQAGVYRARSEAGAAIALPKGMLPALNQLAKLSRVLFDASGKRQPLRFTVRSVPGGITSSDRVAQPTVAFLQVGKASVYGFNQRITAEPMSVDWWSQGVALVGSESTAARSGRKHTETLEVSDSAWSLFRLLQKTTLDSEGISTWRILGNGPQEGTVIRFVLSPDPWAPFRVKLQ